MTDARTPSADDSVDPDVIDAEVVDGEATDAEVKSAEANADAINSDAINTEAVNDGEEVAPASAGATAPSGASTSEHPDTALAAQRLDDLQRLNAEYVNYKRRVDRDRSLVQERAVKDVLESLLPVLDDIHAAREHGDLSGPFAAIADKLETTLGRFGLTRFGEVGEEFDPMQHEALMHAPWDASNPKLPTDATAMTVVQVLQPGYRSRDAVVRPARVAVADPE